MAADAAGYASMPLPLFYSMSQAGRAIAAAHRHQDWELHGHGLQVDGPANGHLLETIIKPSRGVRNSFRGVADAIGSPGLNDEVTLGALWAANPDLSDVPVPSSVHSWPTPLTFLMNDPERLRNDNGELIDPEQYFVSTTGACWISVKLSAATGQELTDALRPYPTLRDAFGYTRKPEGGAPAGPGDPVVVSVGPDGVPSMNIGKPIPINTNMATSLRMERTFASVIEKDLDHANAPDALLKGHALPELGGGPSPFPLMLWWGLLLGLSSLARYYPAAWTEAIDLDSSELAVSLERVLDIARERVPMRILRALKMS